jgi:hypothetical protein
MVWSYTFWYMLLVHLIHISVLIVLCYTPWLILLKLGTKEPFASILSKS